MTEAGRTGVVRAGKDAVHIEEFRSNSLVALGLRFRSSQRRGASAFANGPPSVP